MYQVPNYIDDDEKNDIIYGEFIINASAYKALKSIKLYLFKNSAAFSLRSHQKSFYWRTLYTLVYQHANNKLKQRFLRSQLTIVWSLYLLTVLNRECKQFFVKQIFRCLRSPLSCDINVYISSVVTQCRGSLQASKVIRILQE